MINLRRSNTFEEFCNANYGKLKELRGILKTSAEEREGRFHFSYQHLNTIDGFDFETMSNEILQKFAAVKICLKFDTHKEISVIIPSHTTIQSRKN